MTKLPSRRPEGCLIYVLAVATLIIGAVWYIFVPVVRYLFM